MINTSEFIRFVYDNNLTGLGWIDLVDLSLENNGKFSKFGAFMYLLFGYCVTEKLVTFLKGYKYEKY